MLSPAERMHRALVWQGVFERELRAMDPHGLVWRKVESTLTLSREDLAELIELLQPNLDIADEFGLRNGPDQ